ncbi:MAG: choice-of-anchor J domain-containing protein [Bacteroidales bacterium]|nr:choice-of-anchor J domain-containing protein [Bacteroidales bacterium]
MNTKLIILTFTAFLGFSLMFSSCVNQKFEDPTTCSQVDLTANKTIAELKTIYIGDTLRITDDIIIEGIVTSTDQYGNFYKEIVIQDETDAIAIQVDASYMYNKYPLGQKVFIKCKDLYIGEYGEVIKLGSTYEEYGFTYFGRIQGDVVIESHIINSCENAPIEPAVITLADVGSSYTYKLVKFENVQFMGSELNTTWADVENLETINHNIIDENNNSLIVRTSGYANFAKDTLPDGSGYIIGILGKYNGDYQLYVRSTDDAVMNNARFKEALLKDFSDEDLYSGGWTNYVVEGASWSVGTIGGTYGQCKNYNGTTNVPTESWYISPSLNLTAFTAPFLSFQSAWGYSGDVLKVRYSSDYDGTSDPNTATWTDLSPSFYTGTTFWTWQGSGNLSLPTNTKYVAFVYTGSSSSGRTWEIDSIIIDESK